MANYLHRAVIETSFQFPADMLRYDKCYPDSEQDSLKIQSTWDTLSMAHTKADEMQQITVAKVTQNSLTAFTPARWESFCCRIRVLPPTKF